MMDQSGIPFVASVAAMASRLTSVTVSNPEAEQEPDGHIRQPLLTRLNSGRKIPGEEAALVEQHVEILFDIVARRWVTCLKVRYNRERDQQNSMMLDHEQKARRDRGTDDPVFHC